MFSVLHLNNTGTRGLICVPLTERKRVKRHSETIKRERERDVDLKWGKEHLYQRQSTVCNFTLFFGYSGGIAPFR